MHRSVSHRIVLIGAGLAGYAAARALNRAAERRGDKVQVTLVSPSAHACLSPLVPGLISGWVSAWQLLVPLRPMLPCVRVVTGHVSDIDPRSKDVHLEGPAVRTGCEPPRLPYDSLVLATGLKPSDASVPGAPYSALALRSPEDAVRVRNRLAEALEAASGEDSARRRRAILTVAVVGGGPRAWTAALEIRRYLRRTAELYDRIEPDDPQVVLLSRHASDSALLGHLPTRMLEEEAIAVVEDVDVLSVEPDHLMVRTRQHTPERVDARTVVWTDCASPAACVAQLPGATLAEGRLRVDEMLRVVGVSDVMALGDCASACAPGWASASAAGIWQQAKLVAGNVVAQTQGKPLKALGPAPWFQPLVFAREQGLVLLGKRPLAGRLASGLARGWMIHRLPHPSYRLAVHSSWLLDRWVFPSGEIASRLQLGSHKLYLTAPPPIVGPSIPSAVRITERIGNDPPLVPPS